jgi:hypothetical protein
LVLQHSPELAFQREMLPQLEQAARRGELRPPDVAMLTDRVLVGEGKPQRYGNSFAIEDSVLVPHRIEDLAKVDSLRRSAGLRPMDEYVRALFELYRMRVVWPPGTAPRKP